MLPTGRGYWQVLIQNLSVLGQNKGWGESETQLEGVGY